jgi:hypothetical protein
VKRHLARLAILCLLFSSWAVAEVADSGSSGFTIKMTLTIQASPEEVYRRLIRVGDWWDPEHTYQVIRTISASR